MPHLSALSSKLAAKSGIRQTQALVKADRAAAAVDEIIMLVLHNAYRAAGPPIDTTKSKLIRLPNVGEIYHTLTALPRAIPEVIAVALHGLAQWGYHAAVDPLLELLPPALEAAAIVTEAATKPEPPKPYQVKLSLPHGRLAEKVHGATKLLRDYRKTTALTKKQLAELYRQIVFPPPDAETVNHIVFAPAPGQASWQERIEGITRLASPESIAQVIAKGYADGIGWRGMVKHLTPLVAGTRADCMRIARTEGMRVAHQVQMQAWDDAGEMVIGFQVHAVKDHRTRSWHAARSGNVYHKHPKGNELGLDRMPSPPQESPDPRDRPPGEPFTAHNCRCWLSPVLSPLPGILNDPDKRAIFTTNQKKLVPDPLTFSDWFRDKATDKERMLAVGARRYLTMARKLPTGRKPAWEDFIDARHGALMPLQTLKDETRKERDARRGEVMELIAKRRSLLAQVATFGFLEPE